MTPRQYGLTGSPLSHSLSPGIFREIFKREGVSGATYDLYPLDDITGFPSMVRDHPRLCGVNVTIPYKEKIISCLDCLDGDAREIGAVNCVDIKRQGDKIFTKGYNTDHVAFYNSLSPLLRGHHRQALVLGTGGAARAVVHALKKVGLPWLTVSRTPGEGQVGYGLLKHLGLKEHQVIINTTPLGMYPDEGRCPDIPYEDLTDKHLLFDLVYNPGKTVFLENGSRYGACTCNGMEMLRLQAAYSWAIWNGK